MNNNTTTINPKNADKFHVSDILLVIQVLIALVGAIGNLLVVIVITSRANMKTTMNLYLRNLAIADLGVLCVVFPFNALSISIDRWIFGEFICKYIWPGIDVFYGASIWSITVIAIERYRNIISRRSFRQRTESARRVTIKILVIWLVSFLVVSVPLITVMEYHEEGDKLLCFPNWYKVHFGLVLMKVYVLVVFLFWYVVPLVVIAGTYSKISSQLKQSTTFHKRMHGDISNKSQIIKDEEKQRLKQNKKAKRLLTPLVIVFATTMIPLNILRMVVAFYPELLLDSYVYIYISITLLFVVINSAVDPLVYYISSKEFRKVLKPMLCCKQVHNNSDPGTRATEAMIATNTKTASYKESLLPQDKLDKSEV